MISFLSKFVDFLIFEFNCVHGDSDWLKDQKQNQGY